MDKKNIYKSYYSNIKPSDKLINDTKAKMYQQLNSNKNYAFNNLKFQTTSNKRSFNINIINHYGGVLACFMAIITTVNSLSSLFTIGLPIVPPPQTTTQTYETTIPTTENIIITTQNNTTSENTNNTSNPAITTVPNEQYSNTNIQSQKSDTITNNTYPSSNPVTTLEDNYTNDNNHSQLDTVTTTKPNSNITCVSSVSSVSTSNPSSIVTSSSVTSHTTKHTTSTVTQPPTTTTPKITTSHTTTTTHKTTTVPTETEPDTTVPPMDTTIVTTTNAITTTVPLPTSSLTTTTGVVSTTTTASHTAATTYETTHTTTTLPSDESNLFISYPISNNEQITICFIDSFRYNALSSVKPEYIQRQDLYSYEEFIDFFKGFYLPTYLPPNISYNEGDVTNRKRYLTYINLSENSGYSGLCYNYGSDEGTVDLSKSFLSVSLTTDFKYDMYEFSIPFEYESLYENTKIVFGVLGNNSVNVNQPQTYSATFQCGELTYSVLANQVMIDDFLKTIKSIIDVRS